MNSTANRNSMLVRPGALLILWATLLFWLIMPFSASADPLQAEIKSETSSSSGGLLAGCNSLAVSPDGSKVYVADEQSGIIFVVDAAAMKLTTAIQVGNVDIGRMVLSPDGRKLYCANYKPNSLLVIDLEKEALAQTIPLEDNAFCMAMSSNGTKLYVGLKNFSILEFDPATNQITKRATLEGDGSVVYGISSIVPATDGRTMYVIGDFKSIKVVNIETGKVIGSIPVFLQSSIVDKLEAQLTAITGKVIKPPPQECSASGIILSPNEQVIIASELGSSLQISNAHDGRLLRQIRSEGGPTGNARRLAINPDGRMLYMIDGVSAPQNLLATDLLSGTVMNRLSTKSYPTDILLSRATPKLFVVDHSSVYRIDISTMTINGAVDFAGRRNLSAPAEATP